MSRMLSSCLFCLLFSSCFGQDARSFYAEATKALEGKNYKEYYASIQKAYALHPYNQNIKGIVAIYDRNKRFEKWFGASLLSVGLLVPFSFLPAKIERVGVGGALFDTFIMVTVCLACYIVAFKLGAFKNPYKARLEKDLVDWNELKELVAKME